MVVIVVVVVVVVVVVAVVAGVAGVVVVVVVAAPISTCLVASGHCHAPWLTGWACATLA